MPEAWGVSDVQAEQELADYAADQRFCLRLLPLYIAGGQNRPLQPRHYHRLPGSLARVDFTILDTAETSAHQTRPVRVHTLQAVVSSVQILLETGYDKYTSSTWDGKGLSWS